jgi:hypothetical protein
MLEKEEEKKEKEKEKVKEGEKSLAGTKHMSKNIC